MQSSHTSLSQSSSSKDSDKALELEVLTIESTAEESASSEGVKHSRYYEDFQAGAEDDEDEDDNSGSEQNDGGGTALLGGESRARSRDWSYEEKPMVWAQVRSIVIESAPTLLLTTTGLLLTGELLDHVSKWRSMEQINELVMIIPVILNLKGNLEMNMSARLATFANMGELDKPDQRRSMILGNLSLLQVQAAVVSFVAACVSLLLNVIVPHVQSSKTAAGSGVIPTMQNMTVEAHLLSRHPRLPLPSPEKRLSDLTEFIMVASSAMSAACLSSLILGSFMCGLIVLCRRFGRDPDNIAPPVAACLGDLVTLFLLGVLSMILINFVRTPIPFVLCILIILSSLSCLFVTYHNSHVKDLLKQGWSSLFGAMIISSCTGIVLDVFVDRYKGYGLLAIVIGGLPGGVGSIFISRLSTALHAAALHVNVLPHMRDDTVRNSDSPSPRLVMITLFLVTLPIEILFLTILRTLGWLRLPVIFVVFSVLFFCAAVTISLFIARWLTNFLWKRGLDPDMYALPIHSALMDLVGQSLLVCCFEVVSLLGVQVKAKAYGQ